VGKKKDFETKILSGETITLKENKDCPCNDCKTDNGRIVYVVCQDCINQKHEKNKYQLIFDDAEVTNQKTLFVCSECLNFVHQIDKKYKRMSSVEINETKEKLSEDIVGYVGDQDLDHVMSYIEGTDITTTTGKKKKISKQLCDNQEYYCGTCYENLTPKKDFFLVHRIDTLKSQYCEMCKEVFTTTMCIYKKIQDDSKIQNWSSKKNKKSLKITVSANDIIDLESNSNSSASSDSNMSVPNLMNYEQMSTANSTVITQEFKYDSNMSAPNFMNYEQMSTANSTKKPREFIYVKNISDIPCKKYALKFCIPCGGICFRKINKQDKNNSEEDKNYEDSKVEMEKELHELLTNDLFLASLKNASNYNPNIEYTISSKCYDTNEFHWTNMLFIILTKYKHLKPGDFFEIHVDFSKLNLQILNSVILNNSVQVPKCASVLPENSVYIPRCSSVIVKCVIADCAVSQNYCHPNIANIATESLLQFREHSAELIQMFLKNCKSNETNVKYYTIESLEDQKTQNMPVNFASVSFSYQNLKEKNNPTHTFKTLKFTTPESSKESAISVKIQNEETVNEATPLKSCPSSPPRLSSETTTSTISSSTNLNSSKTENTSCSSNTSKKTLTDLNPSNISTGGSTVEKI
jgi:hypothetical protein